MHPVIQFTDRILYHRDKTVVAAFVSDYAINQYLRQLMLVGNPPVTLPFRATPEDLEIYTSLLGMILARDAGLHQPDLRLAAAPAAAHQVPG